jgi:benzodiazapine receptor
MQYPWLKLVIALGLTLGLGLLGGLFTAPEIDGWYASLQKPFFNPPNAIFAPVWTLLYLMMGISVYLVWKQPGSLPRNRALWLFVCQFILNFCWSIIFFRLHAIGWALVEIVVLWILILATITSFVKVSRLAAILLVPYLAWVSFAAVLTGFIYKLN